MNKKMVDTMSIEKSMLYSWLVCTVNMWVIEVYPHRNQKIVRFIGVRGVRKYIIQESK
jgi:CRISPR/Cas system-associated exonuclease Cas4 (RecB family)